MSSPLVPLFIVIIVTNFMGTNAFICFSRHASKSAIAFLTHHHSNARPLSTYIVQPHNFIALQPTSALGRKLYRHSRLSFSIVQGSGREGNDVPQGPPVNDNPSTNNIQDDTYQIREESLHFYLRQLGIDADALADAAFRSVATTGDYFSWSSGLAFR